MSLKSIQYLDYAVEGNLISPLLFLSSEKFTELIADYDSAILYIKTVRRKKRGA